MAPFHAPSGCGRIDAVHLTAHAKSHAFATLKLWLSPSRRHRLSRAITSTGGTPHHQGPLVASLASTAASSARSVAIVTDDLRLIFEAIPDGLAGVRTAPCW